MRKRQQKRARVRECTVTTKDDEIIAILPQSILVSILGVLTILIEHQP